VVPVVLGTGLAPVLFLLFTVNLLGQISGPSESAVLPHVTTKAELASAASLVSLSSNVGTAFGTAILAPILVRVAGEEAVFVVAGLMLIVAATRVFDLPTDEPDRKLDLRVRPRVSVRSTLEWLAGHPAIATMIFVSVLAGTASIVVQTLGPRYVQSVLDVDPTSAVYVFAPSSVGLLAALAVTPRLVKRFGERPVALAGFAIVALVLLGLGMVGRAGDLIAPINILRITHLFGLDISRDLRTAGFLSIWLGFGLALTQISVQAYINRRVPLTYQGRTFALQSMLKNGFAIGPLLTLGAIATVVGVQTVLIAAPFALLLGAGALVRVSYQFRGEPAPSGLDVATSYWEETDEVISDPDRRNDATPAPEGAADGEHHPT
jgi:Na+/melibiose symporter-like transporter